MTDNEIIKALNCCMNADCINCPRWTDEWYSGMCNDFLKDVLDLINRQKAEIERLEKENEILSKNADTAFQDGLNEAQDLYAEQIKNEIKAEARKEFAGRINGELVYKNTNMLRKLIKTVNSVMDSCIISLDKALEEMEKES